MQRRSFLKFAACGAATLSLGGGRAGAEDAPSVDLKLTIEEAMVEQIDGTRLFMLLFFGEVDGERRPSPKIRAVEGQRINLTVENLSPRRHAFELTGAPGSRIEGIPTGGVGRASFTAPVGGSYLYLDPTDAPVYRNLGLHGAFISKPRDGATPLGAPTPYSRATQTEELRILFDALGDAAPRPVPLRLLPGEAPQARFPGDAWVPDDPERDKIWVFSSLDPKFHREAERGLEIDPARFVAEYEPRYFTINNLAGFDAANEPSIVPKGYVGQPTVIRILNAGLPTFSPHIHGNHVMLLTEAAADGAVRLRDNLIELDSWTMKPLQRIDVLLPFEQPPDVPAAVWPPFQEPFPMFYPMHCHQELSQTAAGGSYPQGLITDWEILGPLRRTA